MLDDFTRLGTRTSGLTLDADVMLDENDRRRHLYVIGKTGTGKSTFLLSLILQDLAAGHGIALLDPHGDLARTVIGSMPRWRIPDCLYLDPADLQHPVGFNPLYNVKPDQRPVIAAHIVAAFRHIWADSWGPRLEYLLLNSLRLLLDTPGSTLLGLPALLVNDGYRDRLLARCSDPQVRQFWTQELAAWGDQFKAEALSPVQNKIGALLSPPLLRNILGQHKPTLDIAAIMNGGRILVANLSKGQLGEGPSYLIGAWLATAFAQAAQARAIIPEMERRDFHLYVDEFQNFATELCIAFIGSEKIPTVADPGASVSRPASADVAGSRARQRGINPHIPRRRRRRQCARAGARAAIAEHARRAAELPGLDTADAVGRSVRFVPARDRVAEGCRQRTSRCGHGSNPRALHAIERAGGDGGGAVHFQSDAPVISRRNGLPRVARPITVFVN